ncbi:hypothetical protein ACFLXT_03395 [Chloroflexota bacterium]
MFETLTNINNIATPALRGILAAIEILLTGFVLYWLWEVGLKLFSLLGKRIVKSAPARPVTTTAYIPKVSSIRKSIAGVGSESGSTSNV